MATQNTHRPRTPSGRFALIHGARSLAIRLERNRLEPRMRRTLNKMQIELATAPIETVLALVLARYARKEIIAQHGEAQLLADSNATPSKWLLGLWNSMRRDAELIAVLEPRVSEDRTPSLAEYLEAKESAASATCAASSAVGATSPSTSAGALKGEPAAAPGEPTPFRTDPGDPPPQHPE